MTMSFRMLTNRLLRHGKIIFQCYCKREIYTKILDHGKNRAISTNLTKIGGQKIISDVSLRANSGIFRFGQHARRLFIDNILNRVTTVTYSAEIRNQATKKLFFGDSAPFFALIGVSLATGAGVLTKDDELEGVCREIREAAYRMQSLSNKESISIDDENFNIDLFNVGQPIAKGCSAVVYAASFKDDITDASSNITLKTQSNEENSSFTKNYIRPEMMQNISRFVHNSSGNEDNLTSGYAVSNLNTLNFDSHRVLEVNTHSNNMLQDINDINKSNKSSINQYPMALKMMFNYEFQSNAMSIIQGMYKETVPALRRMATHNSENSAWEKLLENQTIKLTPHPNIVTMYGYFCGEFRNFKDGHILYPDAQPQRINPEGCGRNMSLYLLMKRYDCHLCSLLEQYELNLRSRVILFAQLLEAVAHINRHGIAHRDIKSDNILIERQEDNMPPLLVLSDFGCCTADKKYGLHIPYTSLDTFKGGNPALMAPEIINKIPGSFTILNYEKSDLWACGAVAYEIFGEPNPFYVSKDKKRLNTLKNDNYKLKDLPKLSLEKCPEIVQSVIRNILNPNPSNRLSPDIAANVLQIFLWGPSKWLQIGGNPSSSEVLQWLLSLTTKVLCEGKKNDESRLHAFGRLTYVEYTLICSFLSRVQLRGLRETLSWIQSVL